MHGDLLSPQYQHASILSDHSSMLVASQKPIVSFIPPLAEPSSPILRLEAGFFHELPGSGGYDNKIR
jgi:hypothetical protein